MTTMTFASIHGAPRRAAARRIYTTAQRFESTSTPPAAAVAVIGNVTDAKRSRDQIGLIATVGIVIALHAAIITIVNQSVETAPIPSKASMLAVDIAPPPPPPPIIKPKPLPQIAAVKPVTRQPSTSVPTVPSVTETPAPSAETVQVAVATPSVPAPAPTLAPAPAPEPVTEPRGYAGYLNNPAPSYPLAAQKHGLQGKVILKIHVLTNGQPDNISVAKSSGYAILDEAAVKAVTAWIFEPAKRGQKPIDGWVNVPINFNLS
ncbi:energy transducer TonB [Solimicrobium silvestre]|uniref:Protein TonB n=1 Tax=Solimicrobium silvestre TaxID=2099400 RepID=A0A2S9H2R1_9BURK|nr:energy transducer TonB [Solimicrobium silvestre]PRC94258.1 TonB family C-terminal domain [Solimicrobium silvestre]